MTSRSHIYFVSDAHLGVDGAVSSEEREERLIAWLDNISQTAAEVHIVGDLFDYWYEYKETVPKGYFKLLVKLSQLTAQGIMIHYHMGNHDMWHSDYLSEEIGLILHASPLRCEYGDKVFYISHGDELIIDTRYRMVRSLLRSKLCRWLYRWIHPDIGIPLMRYMSRRSRHHQTEESDSQAANQVPLSHIEQHQDQYKEIDIVVNGHWHNPVVTKVASSDTTYVNLGDWYTYFTYAVYDGDLMQIERWD